MELLHKLITLLRHLSDDAAWRDMINHIGLTKLYLLLFAIVFCETGLVIWPFLPGDSLIFAIGAVAGRAIGIDPITAGILLILAALTGDNVNYWLGRRLGPAVFRREDSRLFNKKHLIEAQNFYEKYGSKTIILARFVPIVRTFAPFVAGIGKMNYARFLAFSIFGAILWVTLCLTAGYFLGSRPFFKQHFEIVMLAIVFISVLPALFHILQARGKTQKGILTPAPPRIIQP
jgi:membrane-associated protein